MTLRIDVMSSYYEEGGLEVETVANRKELETVKGSTRVSFTWDDDCVDLIVYSWLLANAYFKKCPVGSLYLLPYHSVILYFSPS